MVFIDKKAQKQLELPKHIKIKVSNVIDVLEKEGFLKNWI
jgi:hypothetical protein